MAQAKSPWNEQFRGAGDLFYASEGSFAIMVNWINFVAIKNQDVE